MPVTARSSASTSPLLTFRLSVSPTSLAVENPQKPGEDVGCIRTHITHRDRQMKFKPAALTELPALMADPGYLSPCTPLMQFIQDWNWHPHLRSEMVDGKPDCDSETLASIGVVLHALCERDGFELPGWVENARASSPRLLNGRSATNAYGECVRQESPSVCGLHRVFFEAEMLEKGILENEKEIQRQRQEPRPGPQSAVSSLKS